MKIYDARSRKNYLVISGKVFDEYGRQVTGDEKNAILLNVTKKANDLYRLMSLSNTLIDFEMCEVFREQWDRYCGALTPRT